MQLIDPAAPSFDHVMERIAYKHISLGIRPEQYTIVGHHLLGAVGEVLGDAVTPEIADAWNEVYWLFATQLIAEEARLYQQAGVDPARPLRPYRVIRRIEETQDVISLVLEPADDGELPEISPGQYVSVFVDLPDGQRQPRQYTVSSTGLGQPVADHRAPGPRRRTAPRTARSRRTCTTGSRSGTCWRSAHRPATSSSSRRTGRCCWPAPAPGSPPCCPSSNTSPAPNPTARSSSRTPTAPPRTTRCATPCCTSGRQLDDFTAYTWYETVDPDDHRSTAGLMDLTEIPLPAGHPGLHLRAAAVHAARPLHPAGQGGARLPDPVRGVRPRPLGRPGGTGRSRELPEYLTSAKLPRDQVADGRRPAGR